MLAASQNLFKPADADRKSPNGLALPKPATNPSPEPVSPREIAREMGNGVGEMVGHVLKALLPISQGIAQMQGSSLDRLAMPARSKDKDKKEPTPTVVTTAAGPTVTTKFNADFRLPKR